MLGGPIGGADGDLVLLAVDADDEAIRARLAEDPWPEDLLTVESIRPGLVWLRGSPGS